MSGLYCDKCERNLRLTFNTKYMQLDNKKIAIVNTPMLECTNCNIKYIPYTTQQLINIVFVNGEKHDNGDLSLDFIEKEIDELLYSEEEIDEWYDFNKIKQKACNDKFISEKVKFLYDRDDFYFIPGLYREWNMGFLTPVFFNIEVLLKYIYHPDYGMDIGADTYGYIYKGDEHYISFGINENNKIILWLGDIIKLNVEEQFYLRSENINSDHSIASEFYDAQIDVIWAEPSKENTLLKKRLELNEKVRNVFNTSLAQLDTETLRITKNIHKLVVDTNDAFKDLIIPLNELIVESINNKEIKKDLKANYPDIGEELKEKKGIKLLQLWMEKNTKNIDVNCEIAPIYVLYDLRLVSAHLYSDEKREELLESCCTRLNLDKNEKSFICIANKLVENLTTMYEKFKENLVERENE